MPIQPETRFEQSNLTYGQQLMWVGQRLQPAIPLYNMIYTFMVHGALDVDAFRAAFAALVASTENLRSVIREVDDFPQLVVLEQMPATVEYLDFAGEVHPQITLEQWLEKRRAVPFDLSLCLFDCALIRLAPERFVWYFGQHHIIMDVMTSVLLYQRMSDLYQQVAAGQALAAPEMPSYHAYKAYEQQLHASDAYPRALKYWQEQLARPGERLRFYGSRNTSGINRTDRVAVPLSAQQLQRLDEVAMMRGIRSLTRDLTYSNLFAALILAYLYRISQQNTLRLGTPFANRATPTLQQTAGLFIEVLSLTVDIQPQDTFIDLVKKVSAANLGALQHLMPGIGTAQQNRAYSVLMNYITATFPDFAGIPTDIEWIHSGYGDSDHAIRVQIHDMNRSGAFRIDFDLNTGIFAPAEYELAVAHFQRVLDACLEQPERPLNSISLLSADEEQARLIDFNATTQDYPAARTVVDLFEEQVRRTPQAVAVSMGQAALSYDELNQQANRLARVLREKGVRAETLVPVCLDHSLNMVVTLLAILKAGGAYVPIDPNHPDERIAFLLDDVGDVPVVVADAPHHARLSSFRGTLLLPDAPLSGDGANLPLVAQPANLAYVIYTSGSTGNPKGVQVQHDGLTNYLWWAKQQYTGSEPSVFALYSSLAFDLTVTSIYVPLITGGAVRVYRETGTRGMVIRDVFAENAVDVVKLTPSHLGLIREMDFSKQRISCLIVGGEDFKTELAQAIHRLSNGRIAQFNEYGPTEATVACMLHRYHPQQDTRPSVPIGTPSHNMRVYVLDRYLQPTATGVIGELYLSGIGVARGYLNRDSLSAERFLTDPFDSTRRMYKTGDLARWLPSGQIEFLGRADRQVKIGGARIEPGEIEAALLAHPAIRAAAVDVRAALESSAPSQPAQIVYCARCGLASDFPGLTFDGAGICSICRTYESYKDKAQAYFMDMDALQAVVAQIKARSTGDYDCVALLSGGKDSSYMIYRLVEMGLRVLAFTLDNGFISDEAKANVRRITAALGVDHVFGETPFMNSIFVDSLRRYANVCNGCFKTIYTMAINLAREKGISTVVTGLSRGQFFETRLTEEVFARDDFDVSAIDESIARARKAYHQRDDIISRSLDVDVFRDEHLYDDIQFVDFYRYCDVDLSEVYEFLQNYAPWIRPSDTGRSTNCLINDLGIYVHKKQRGFHNYALPYSWDVRMGHKTRDEALEELNDEIDEVRVKRMMAEIGYHDLIEHQPGEPRLVAYYVADQELTATELRAYLAQHLPDFMVPSYFVALAEMPLSTNGKIRYELLPDVSHDRANVAAVYSAPSTDLQSELVAIWQSVMNIDRIGIYDNFFDLGGHSLPAIRISSRINSRYGIELPLDLFFSRPTVAELAVAVEDILMAEIENLSDEDVLRLLGEDDQ
jgi:amino acid adenylation domain-containing protein